MINYNQNLLSSAANGPGNDYDQFRRQASIRGMWLPMNLTNPMGQMQQQPMQQPMQQAPQRPTIGATGQTALNNQFNRLSIRANDALYGGLLGYNPKPIVSPTGDTFNPPDPTGGFRFPFGLLNGMGGQ